MRKLELKDIAGYLPYELHSQVFKNAVLINGYELLKYSVMYYIGDYGEAARIKPILRPISDLYKTITHNGKEIIPIVELAEITVNVIKTEYRNSERTIVAYTEKGAYYLQYESLRLSRTFLPIGDIMDDSFSDEIPYLRVLDFLNELKIDYRGLIDSGLAISVYDLPENPYK